jgi:hypothetical protein
MKYGELRKESETGLLSDQQALARINANSLILIAFFIFKLL